MKFDFIKYLLLLKIMIVISACQSTKFIPEGQYLLDKVKIESDVPGYKTMELKPYVRQLPNYKMLGLYKTMFHLYNIAGRDTTNRLNQFIRRIGEKPVVFDSALVLKTESELHKFFVNMGYINANVSSMIIWHDKKADVIYQIQGNRPYRIRYYTVSISDSTIFNELFGDDGEPARRIAGESTALRIPLIKEGGLFDRNLLNAERERITTLLQNRGYYAFTKEAITYDVDSALNSCAVDLKLKLRIPDDVTTVSVGKKFYYDNISFYMNCNPLKQESDCVRQDSLVSNGYTIFYTGKKPLLKSEFLMDNCFLISGYPYSKLMEDYTYSSFSNLHALNNIRIRYDKKLRNDTAWLDCRILIVPARKQTIAFSLEETNTTCNLGIAAAIDYTHRNLFHGAEIFNFRQRGSYEAIANLSNSYLEFGGEASILMSKFIFPFISTSFLQNIRTSTEFSLRYNYQTRSEYDRKLLSGCVGYQWQERGRQIIHHRFDMLEINYVFLPRIDSLFMNMLPRFHADYTNQFIVGSAYSYYYTTFDNAQKQKNTCSFRFSFESSGNLLYGLGSMSNWKKDTIGSYRLFGTPFAQFVKGDFNYTRSIVFDKQNSIVWRIGGGIGYPYGNSKMLPFEKQYYSGGANSIRAWQVRRIGPGNYMPKATTTFFNQSGDIKLDLNIEYRSHLLGKLETATFIDAGNIWTVHTYEGQEDGRFRFDSFYKEIAIGYGLGLRIDFNYFLIRFDCGEKAYNPAKYGKERWAILDPNLKDNFAWHIAVGYPF